jgi:hypothetical protein
MKKLSEIKGTLKEGKLGKLPDPPPMIMMRRKAIRIFPNGLRVALYHNDKLDLDVSVPYHSGDFENKELPYAKMAKEENSFEALHESIVRALKRGVKLSQPIDIEFENGSSTRVQPSVAAAILKLQKMINTTNKKKLATKVAQSLSDLNDVVRFTNKELG